MKAFIHSFIIALILALCNAQVPLNTIMYHVCIAIQSVPDFYSFHILGSYSRLDRPLLQYTDVMAKRTMQHQHSSYLHMRSKSMNLMLFYMEPVLPALRLVVRVSLLISLRML